MAVLLDLDDTILNDTGDIHDCWRDACVAHQADLGETDPAALHEIIDRTRRWFWSDPERHRRGRLDMDAATREVVTLALQDLGAVDPILAGGIAARYRQQRDARLRLLPGAVETVKWLRESGCRLALVTNGDGGAQRRKIVRFGLTDLFDSILVEGELGFGKPDPKVYTRALRDLSADAADAWMVGDNLEFDIAQPQRMGVFGIWIDRRGTGLPDASPVQPNRIVRHLADLRQPI